MKTKIYQNDIVEITGENAAVKEIDDLFGLLFAYNCSGIILKKEHIPKEFFDLSTGMAGEFLQKFSNYRKRLAITGDYTDIRSKAFQDFICESNKTKQILFVNTADEAVKLWNGGGT
jgi:hypothetical protein